MCGAQTERDVDSKTALLTDSHCEEDLHEMPKATTLSTTRKNLAAVVLVLNGLFMFLSINMRSGFLSGAFTRRAVPGPHYGIMEASIVSGNIIVYITGCSSTLLKHFTSRTLIAGMSLVMSSDMLATGLVYLSDNNTLVLVVSGVFRVVQGFVGYWSFTIYIDFINAHFPSKFDLVNGFLNMGVFVGHGIADSIGCALYDSFGYLAPYLLGTVGSLIGGVTALIVLPDTPTYLASHSPASSSKLANSPPNSPANSIKPVKKETLSWWCSLPILLLLFVNTTIGYLQVTLTSYLVNNFGESYSYAGGVLTLLSVGMSVGSVCGGSLIQSGLISSVMQMAVGSTLIGVGMLCTFPSESWSRFYDTSPETAFPAVCLAGLGSSLATVASLRAMFDFQIRKNGELTAHAFNTLTDRWIISYFVFYYSGAVVSGVLSDILLYSETAQILVGFCGLGALICIPGHFTLVKPRHLNEKTHLLT